MLGSDVATTTLLRRLPAQLGEAPRRHLPVLRSEEPEEPATTPGWMVALARRGKRGESPRPHRRGDCASVPRPCPFVGCRYHLWIRAITARGILQHQDREPWELRYSCALDVADEGLLADRSAMEAAGLIRPSSARPRPSRGQRPQRAALAWGELEALAALLGTGSPAAHQLYHGAVAHLREALNPSPYRNSDE